METRTCNEGNLGRGRHCRKRGSRANTALSGIRGESCEENRSSPARQRLCIPETDVLAHSASSPAADCQEAPHARVCGFGMGTRPSSALAASVRGGLWDVLEGTAVTRAQLSRPSPPVRRKGTCTENCATLPSTALPASFRWLSFAVDCTLSEAISVGRRAQVLELACAGSSALTSGRDRAGSATAPLSSAAAILELCGPSVGAEDILSCLCGTVQKIRGTPSDTVLCIPGRLAAADADSKHDSALVVVATSTGNAVNEDVATASGVLWEDCEVCSVSKKASGVLRTFRDVTIDRLVSELVFRGVDGQQGRQFSLPVGSGRPPRCTDVGASAYVRWDLNEHGTRRAGPICSFDAVPGKLIFHVGQVVFHSSCNIAKLREHVRAFQS